MSFRTKTLNPDFSLAAYLWIPGQARNDTKGRHKGTKADWIPGQDRKDTRGRHKGGKAQRQTGFLVIPDLIRDQNDTVPLRKSATIREIGNDFNRDDSTIRFAVHQLRRRLNESEGFQNQSEELKRQKLA